MAAFLAGCAGRETVTEKMMWSTCPVATLHGLASGFIIRSHDDAGHETAAVITCGHVMKTLRSGPLIVALHRSDETGEVAVAPVIIIPPEGPARNSFYVRHPVHDLAAFYITLPKKALLAAGLGRAPDERTLSTKKLHAGDEVSFLGYPDVYPGTQGGFALLRSGRVASHPAGGPMARGKFLINADVYPGDSGAPVFLSTRTGRPHVVGVLTSRIGADKHAFSHLAVAVDVEVIRETLDLLKKIPPVFPEAEKLPRRLAW